MRQTTFHTNLIKVSERLMAEYCLVIGKEKYEILSLSIHCGDLSNHDDYITDKYERPGLSKWFVSPDAYVRYIDIDLTSPKRHGGLRIDSIRSLSNHDQVVSCGKIYDLIKRSTNGKTPILFNGKYIKDSNSHLFLEKHTFSEAVFHESPRVVGYNFQIPKGSSPYLYKKFLNLKVSKTSDIGSLIDMDDKYQLKINHIPLILNYYEKNKIEDVQKYLKLKDKTLYKYTDLYTRSKNTTQWDILSQYQDVEKSNMRLIAALYGHFF